MHADLKRLPGWIEMCSCHHFLGHRSHYYGWRLVSARQVNLLVDAAPDLPLFLAVCEHVHVYVCLYARSSKKLKSAFHGLWKESVEEYMYACGPFKWSRGKSQKGAIPSLFAPPGLLHPTPQDPA